MGYDIPDKVRYKEKIVFGLDGRQLIYSLLFGLAALLAYGLPIEGQGKFLAPGFIVAIGLGFTFFHLEDRFFERWSYFQAVFLKKDLEKFAKKVIQIDRTAKNCIILNNHELRAVLQITPLNFTLFDDDRKKALIANYRDFLNHLTYPVQIVVRTKRASLVEYYAAYEIRATGLKGGLKELYEDFKKHENKFLKDNSVNEREYYLIICLRLDSKDIDEAFGKLKERVLIAQEKLLDCGIESRRLEGRELMPFAISYFKSEAKNVKKTKEKTEGKEEAQAKESGEGSKEEKEE